MPTWRRLIDKAERPQTIEAVSLLWELKGVSNPSLWKCEDGELYIVKMPEHFAIRTSVKEQVAGHLGKALGAPVTDVCLVHVSRERLAAQQMKQTATNVFHGSRWIPDCEDSEEINDYGVPENRSRFGLLAILYGWLQVQDRQFLYRTRPPKLVYSHDHGISFPSDLANPKALFRIDSQIQMACDLIPEINEAKACLAAVGDDVIASAVAAPPDEWGITLKDRIAMANYLIRARDEILLS
jgi:hypothetical protein